MKKRRIFQIILACFVITASVIVSCNKETFTEKDALLMNDTLLKKGGVISYSVNVVSIANAGMLKSGKATTDSIKGVEGAVVTVSQYKSVQTATTSSNGIVVFSDMRIGNVSVNVKLEGHAPVTYIADLTPSGGLTEFSNTDLSGVTRSASTIVPMFAITGNSLVSISGKVTMESDLTNTAREIVPGSKIVASIDVNDPSFATKYINPFSTAANVNQAGRIIKMVLSSAVSNAVVGVDGTYSLKVPSTASGLPIRLDVADTSINQKLLMTTLNKIDVFGSQTVRTIFGTNVTTSNIPNVSPAYAVIDAPKGVNDQVKTPAVAVATVDNTNGISAVHITDPGAGYADPGGVGYYSLVVKQATNQSATARVYINNGRITKALVGPQGNGYTSDAIPDLTQVVIPFSGKTVTGVGGVITSITLIERGLYRIKPTTVDIPGGGGTGFNYTVTWSWDPTDGASGWFVSSITVLNGGLNYINDKNVSLVSPVGIKTGTAKVLLTTGTITTIVVTNPGDGYVATPDVVISGGNGSGALATAHRDPNTNKIDYITVTNAGSGYTSAPEVNLVFSDIISVAKFDIAVNTEGVITGATSVTGGSGYYTVPKVTINPAVAGIGSGATAYATIGGGKVTGITILTGGSGYVAKNVTTTGTGGGTVAGIGFSVTPAGLNFNVYSGKSVVKDIYLGSGDREIEN
jgi:hypothetical protein